ncbi:MAG: BatD family protein, partial [Paramuribaculum sp.]|nr:BatD family protein [Paramuribaculum sp.]
MKITRFIAFLSAVILFTVPAMSADVSFSVKNPGTVTVGEKYNVTFVVRNGEVSGQAVKAPQISGSSLIFGPSTARMQSYQVINGVSQSSSSIEFNFIYKAEKEGKQTIPAQTITIGGKKYSSSAVSF